MTQQHTSTMRDDTYVPPFVQKLRNATLFDDVHHAFEEARFVPDLPGFSEPKRIDRKFWGYMQKRRMAPRVSDDSDHDSVYDEAQQELEKIKNRENNPLELLRKTAKRRMTMQKNIQMFDERSISSAGSGSVWNTIEEKYENPWGAKKNEENGKQEGNGGSERNELKKRTTQKELRRLHTFCEEDPEGSSCGHDDAACVVEEEGPCAYVPTYDEAVLQSLDRANTIIRNQELIAESKHATEEEPMSETRAMFHRIHKFSMPTKHIEEGDMKCEDFDEDKEAGKMDNLVPRELSDFVGSTSRHRLSGRLSFKSLFERKESELEDETVKRKKVLRFEKRVELEEDRRKKEDKLRRMGKYVEPDPKSVDDKSQKKESVEIKARSSSHRLREEREEKEEQARKLSRNMKFMEEEYQRQINGIITFYSTAKDENKQDAILAVVRRMQRRKAKQNERGVFKRDKSISGLYTREEQEGLRIPDPADVKTYDICRPVREGPCGMQPPRLIPRWQDAPSPANTNSHQNSALASRSGSPKHSMGKAFF